MNLSSVTGVRFDKASLIRTTIRTAIRSVISVAIKEELSVFVENNLLSTSLE